MRRFLALCCFFLLMFSSVCSAESSDYISPNFAPEKIHRVILIPCVTNGTQYVTDQNIPFQLVDELKTNWKLKNTHVDTMFDMMKKVQTLTGNNIFAIMQSNNQEQIAEAYKLCLDYTNRNYDTKVVVEVAVACEGKVFNEGITYNTTSYQTSTSNITSRGNVIPWATITTTTPVQQQHTIGRGFAKTASVGVLLKIFDVASGEEVFERLEARYKESGPLGNTTPVDMGKRIVNKFANDVNNMAEKKK